MKRFTQAQKEKIVDTFNESGDVSVTCHCCRNGCSTASFYRWKKEIRLKREAQAWERQENLQVKILLNDIQKKVAEVFKLVGEEKAPSMSYPAQRSYMQNLPLNEGQAYATH